MTLRLADAILLGDVLKTRETSIYLSLDYSYGCALGGAVLAIGGKRTRENGICEVMANAWPWLTPDVRAHIGWLYSHHEPIEKIAAYADSVDPTPREIEPPVQEPSPVETRQESTVSHG